MMCVPDPAASSLSFSVASQNKDVPVPTTFLIDRSLSSTITTMNTLSSLLLLLLFLSSSTNAYYISTSSTPYFGTRRSAMSMKRGRGSFQKEMGGAGMGKGSSSPSSSSSSFGGSSNVNWCQLKTKTSELPKDEGKVMFIDTELPTLKNGATNPTGAVSVATFGGQTYCFGSSCPSCKIPLAKAKILTSSTGAPTLSCDFCKAAYDLKSGAKVESIESAGLLGGVVKNIMAAQSSGPIPIYKLGEKGGKLLIAVD